MGLDGVGLSGGVGSLSEVHQHRRLKALAKGWVLPSTHPPIPLTAKIYQTPHVFQVPHEALEIQQ